MIYRTIKEFNKTELNAYLNLNYKWLSIDNITCVYISAKKKSYSEAKTACELGGLAKLFYIDNEKEFDIFESMRGFIRYRNKQKESLDQQYFIGLEYNASGKYAYNCIFA
jgi:hypothetical protein